MYDNHFSTVKSDFLADVPVPPEFHDLYRISRENHYDHDDLLEHRSRDLFNIDRGVKCVQRNDNISQSVTTIQNNGPSESEGVTQDLHGPACRNYEVR